MIQLEEKNNVLETRQNEYVYLIEKHESKLSLLLKRIKNFIFKTDTKDYTTNEK